MLFLKRQFSKVCIDSFGGGTRLWNRRIAAFFSIRSVIESDRFRSESSVAALITIGGYL